MFYIYRHILPDGLSYIGKTKDTKQRYQNGRGYKKCPKFYKAIQKYGWDNIQHQILVTTEDEAEARKLERDMIEKYNSISNGYNLNNKKEQIQSKRKIPLQQFEQYDLEGNFIRNFSSAKELWKEGFVPDYVRACCSGRIKTTQGYIWKYRKNF